MLKTNRIISPLVILAGLAVLLLAATAVWAATPAQKDYAAAQKALGDDDFSEAAGMFSRFYREHSDDDLAGSALYWEAYSRYRDGGNKQLKKARSVLHKLDQHFPDSAVSEDADELMMRIEGSLAKRGDPDAARAVTLKAHASGDQDSDTRLAALNALVMMDEDKALPILEKILANRSEKNVEMRRRAVALMMTIDDERTGPIILDVMRNDPDPDTRGTAAMLVGQLPGAEAVGIVRELAGRDQPVEVLKQLILGIGENDDPQAGKLLMEIAGDEGRDTEVRSLALIALGDREEPQVTKYLQDVFARTDDPDIQQHALIGLSERRTNADLKSWFMATAKNSEKSIDARKMCLFWAAESGNLGADDLRSLYAEFEEPELRKQLIFSVADIDSEAGVDLLIEIARNDQSNEMRQMAIFWLGDSGDPRALEYLEELLAGE